MTHRVKVKLDRNHHQIVEALQNAGYAVQSLAAVGHGCPDLLVCSESGDLFLLEIKWPGAHLTDDQAEWEMVWPGQMYVVHTPEEALAACAYRDALKTMKG